MTADPTRRSGAFSSLDPGRGLVPSLPTADGTDPRAAKLELLTAEEDRSSTLQRRRLQWLMVGRLVVATLLLGATMWVGIRGEAEYARFTPYFLSFLITATYGGSVAFAAWLVNGKNLGVQAATQIAFDLVITSALVYVSGGVGSAFTFLYGISVLMAALTIGPGATAITAVCSLGAYLVLGLSLANGWMPHPPDQAVDRYVLSAGDTAFFLFRNLIGLVVVSMLAGSLSSRVLATGGELRRAAQSAMALAQLNDDIVRSMLSGLVSTDFAGVVRSVNPAGAEMFKAQAEDLIGRPLANFLPVAALSVDSGSARREGVATRGDGSRFPVGFSVSALRDSESQDIGKLIMFQDLTEIAELRATAERAERLAGLGRLAAGLAHEIRNPLSSISGSVELVRESKELSDEERQLLRIVVDEVQRLNGLVTTMLRVGKPLEVNRAVRDLAAVVDDVVQVARQGLAKISNVIIDYTRPSEPIEALADGDQIRQVVWNLVKNAIEASSPGDVVKLAVYVNAKGKVVIEVSDEGEGIADNDLDRLFDTFYSGRKQGVGLGLALVKQIVDAHQGRIEVRSKKGVGSTFSVELPQVTHA
jgi:two-component system sensor histidine kinase PilS (NtrC family)